MPQNKLTERNKLGNFKAKVIIIIITNNVKSITNYTYLMG